MIQMSETILNRVVAHAAACYPAESCGMLIGSVKERRTTEYRRCENIYDKMHARDPETFARTSRAAYMIDPKEQERIFDEVQRNRQQVLAICHSHADHDAYFSAEDRLIATPWGEPVYEGVDYIVTSVWNGQFKEMNLFEWNQPSKDWKEHKLK